MFETNVLARSLTLNWVSAGTSFHIMESKDQGNTFRFVNNGQGEGYEGGKSLHVYQLRPNAVYIFKVFAGNRFVYEQTGRKIKIKTLSMAEENGTLY
jgi:hypothetical protein